MPSDPSPPGPFRPWPPDQVHELAIALGAQEGIALAERDHQQEGITWEQFRAEASLQMRLAIRAAQAAATAQDIIPIRRVLVSGASGAAPRLDGVVAVKVVRQLYYLAALEAYQLQLRDQARGSVRRPSLVERQVRATVEYAWHALATHWEEAFHCFSVRQMADVLHVPSAPEMALARARMAACARRQAEGTMEPIDWWGKAVYERYALQCDDAALASIEHALASEYAQEPGAWELKGEILGALGRDEEALAAFDHALQLDPADDFALRGRAKALRNLGRAE